MYILFVLSEFSPECLGEDEDDAKVGRDRRRVPAWYERFLYHDGARPCADLSKRKEED